MKRMFSKSIYVVVVAMTLLSLGASGFASQDQSDSKGALLLIRVDSNKVCMVNDQFFNKEQIPVKVDEKTYYGCCESCKKTLAEKVEYRIALDPVSKKEVDKAKAVIGAQSDGTAFYFESEENLKQYNAQSSD